MYMSLPSQSWRINLEEAVSNLTCLFCPCKDNLKPWNSLLWKLMHFCDFFEVWFGYLAFYCRSALNENRIEWRRCVRFYFRMLPHFIHIILTDYWVFFGWLLGPLAASGYGYPVTARCFEHFFAYSLPLSLRMCIYMRVWMRVWTIPRLICRDLFMVSLHGTK